MELRGAVIPFVTSQRDLAHFSKKKKKGGARKRSKVSGDRLEIFHCLACYGMFAGDFSAARAPKQIGSLQVHWWANKYI